jgi:hypothetical protein
MARFEVKIPLTKFNRTEAVRIIEIEATSGEKAVRKALVTWDFPIRVKNPHKARKIEVRRKKS